MLPTATVFAAPGGEYSIDELKMKVQIPTDWVVFTPDTNDDDTDLAYYGFSSAQEMKEELFYGTDLYLSAYYDIFITGVMSFEDEYSEEIGYLAQMDSLYENLFMLGAQFAEGMAEDGWEYSDFELYENEENVYLKWDMSMDSDDFICYGVGYMTIMNGKYIACFYSKFDELIEPDRQKFQEMVDQVTYTEDAFTAASQSVSSDEGELTNEIAGVLTDNKDLISKMALIAVACFAVIAGIIILFIAMSKSKKKKTATVRRQLAQTQEVTYTAAADKTEYNARSKDDENTQRNLVICDYCKKAVPSESTVCPVCGEKLKK
jgi:hypothetical protein